MFLIWQSISDLENYLKSENDLTITNAKGLQKMVVKYLHC